LRGAVGARHLFLAVDIEYYNHSDRVTELLQGGSQMYALMSVPNDPYVPDSMCLAAFWRVVSHIDPRLFQPEARGILAVAAQAGDSTHSPEGSPISRPTTRGTLVPQFRFREGPGRPVPLD
jgi:hypothetical protein